MDHRDAVTRLEDLGYSEETIEAMRERRPPAMPKRRAARRRPARRRPTCGDCQQRDRHGECAQKRRSGEEKVFVGKARGACFWFIERHEEPEYRPTLMELYGSA